MAKILVVDDQPSITWLMEAVLTAEGHLVATADGGPEAWEKMSDFEPDLVITDVQMPTINGFELVSRIRDRFPGMPCVMMSGDADFEDPGTRSETKRLQICATLPKPFLMAQLIEIVDQSLAPERKD